MALSTTMRFTLCVAIVTICRGDGRYPGTRSLDFKNPIDVGDVEGSRPPRSFPFPFDDERSKRRLGEREETLTRNQRGLRGTREIPGPVNESELRDHVASNRKEEFVGSSARGGRGIPGGTGFERRAPSQNSLPVTRRWDVHEERNSLLGRDESFGRREEERRRSLSRGGISRRYQRDDDEQRLRDIERRRTQEILNERRYDGHRRDNQRGIKPPILIYEEVPVPFPVPVNDDVRPPHEPSSDFPDRRPGRPKPNLPPRGVIHVEEGVLVPGVPVTGPIPRLHPGLLLSSAVAASKVQRLKQAAAASAAIRHHAIAQAITRQRLSQLHHLQKAVAIQKAGQAVAAHRVAQQAAKQQQQNALLAQSLLKGHLKKAYPKSQAVGVRQDDFMHQVLKQGLKSALSNRLRHHLRTKVEEEAFLRRLQERREDLIRRLLLLRPHFTSPTNGGFILPAFLPDIPDGAPMTEAQVHQLPKIQLLPSTSLLPPGFRLPPEIAASLRKEIGTAFVEHILRLPELQFRKVIHMPKKEFILTLFPRLYRESVKDISYKPEKHYHPNVPHETKVKEHHHHHIHIHGAKDGESGHHLPPQGSPHLEHHVGGPHLSIGPQFTKHLPPFLHENVILSSEHSHEGIPTPLGEHGAPPVVHHIAGLEPHQTSVHVHQFQPIIEVGHPDCEHPPHIFPHNQVHHQVGESHFPHNVHLNPIHDSLQHPRPFQPTSSLEISSHLGLHPPIGIQLPLEGSSYLSYEPAAHGPHAVHFGTSDSHEASTFTFRPPHVSSATAVSVTVRPKGESGHSVVTSIGPSASASEFATTPFGEFQGSNAPFFSTTTRIPEGESSLISTLPPFTSSFSSSADEGGSSSFRPLSTDTFSVNDRSSSLSPRPVSFRPSFSAPTTPNPLLTPFSSTRNTFPSTTQQPLIATTFASTPSPTFFATTGRPTAGIFQGDGGGAFTATGSSFATSESPLQSTQFQRIAESPLRGSGGSFPLSGSNSLGRRPGSDNNDDEHVISFFRKKKGNATATQTQDSNDLGNLRPFRGPGSAEQIVDQVRRITNIFGGRLQEVLPDIRYEATASRGFGPTSGTAGAGQGFDHHLESPESLPLAEKERVKTESAIQSQVSEAPAKKVPMPTRIDARDRPDIKKFLDFTRFRIQDVPDTNPNQGIQEARSHQTFPVVPLKGFENIPSFLREPPQCAEGKSFCIYPEGYLRDVASTLISRHEEEITRMRKVLEGLQTPSLDFAIATKQIPNLNLSVPCETVDREVQLSWSRDVIGSWLSILQSDPFEQKVVVTTCADSARAKGCRPLLQPRPLVAFHPNDVTGKPYIMEFPLPVSCVYAKPS